MVALDVREPFTQTVATGAGEVVDGVAGECDRVALASGAAALRRACETYYDIS